MHAYSNADSCIAMRPSQAADEAFLFTVYASTRESEMALVNWPQPQRDAFLHMQFNAQCHHYQTYYPHAEYYTILSSGLPVGRMILDRSQDPILVIDIALLPEHRNQGIGTALIKELMAEAARLHRAMMMHVAIFNPARKLYNRLGFIKTGELGIYLELTWHPESE